VSGQSLLRLSIPSPSRGVWHLGFFPIRAYALCIIAGVIVGVFVGNRRFVARGGAEGFVADFAMWSVPAGLIGARIYHVLTDFGAYFGPDRGTEKVLQIWKGGLGIPGGLFAGGLVAWAFCRYRHVPLPVLADAVAPGIALAQALGRWGNWFNSELFGRPTSLPWGLRIAPEFRPPGFARFATFQPTFLYESIWDVGTALLVIWADRRFRLGHGRAFALYVATYAVGRFWIEYLRIDTADRIGPLRLNDWTALIAFVGAVAYLLLSRRFRPGRETFAMPAPVITAGSAPGTDLDREDGDLPQPGGPTGHNEEVGDGAGSPPGSTSPPEPEPRVAASPHPSETEVR
jgi:prolipoprotein diacylglyceryl transferase